MEEVDPVAYDNIIVVIYLGLWYPTRSLRPVMLKSFEGKKKKRAAGVFHSKKTALLVEHRKYAIAVFSKKDFNTTSAVIDSCSLLSPLAWSTKPH